MDLKLSFASIWSDWVISVFLATLLLCLSPTLHAQATSIDTFSFEDPELEQRYRTLIESFRCPVCQNTSLAGSDAPTARDLRQRVFEMIGDGRSDAEIQAWISERYGDFVLYSPPVRGSTLLLWAGPLLMLLLACGILWRVLRSRRSS